MIGFRGENDEGVKYDLSVSHGTNRLNYTLLGSLNLSWGPDSPLNFNIGDIKQKETNVNLDFSYPASDEFNLAWGIEYREEVYQMFLGQKEAWLAGPWATVHLLENPETGSNYGAPGLAANGMPGTNPAAAGIFDRQNWAAYVDTEWDASEDVLLQFAGRAEHFSDFGSTVNGKVAFRYAVAERLTMRGGISTGFRAPTPGQSNFTGIVTSFDGLTGRQVQEGTVRPTSPLAVALGGAPLKPEDAVSFSFGFTAQVTPAFNMTVDWYQISVDNRTIKSRSLPVTGNPQFSELAFYTNSLDTKTQGVDIVGAYNAPWGNGNSTQISLAYNYNDTEVVRQRKVGGINPVSEGTIFNIENNLAKHRATLTLTEGFEKVDWTVRGNFYGPTIDERGGREEVGAELLVDLEISYRVNENFSLVGGANNLFNNYPDKIETRLSQGMTYLRIVYHFR